jgi:hypothetical protein
MAHLPRVWLHVICSVESKAVMKSHFYTSSLALVCMCMWTLDLFAAASSSRDSHTVAAPRGIEFDQRELNALNLLGIRYAKGQGVKRDPRLAMKYFLLSALNGYTPAMANDATVLKLGMVAARLGSNSIGAAEKLAGVIATRVVEACQCSPGQETNLASNGLR